MINRAICIPMYIMIIIANDWNHSPSSECLRWRSLAGWHVYQSADVLSVCLPHGSGMPCPCQFEVRLLFHHSNGPSKLITFKHGLHLDPLRLPGPQIRL